MDIAELRSRVRQMIKDDPNYNKLVSGEEFSDNDIDLALEAAAEEWNNIGKKTSYGVEGVPQPMQLCWLAVAQLLTMGGIRKERNRLAYTDGGVSVNPDDKLQTYMSAAGAIRQAVYPLIQKYKLRFLFGYGITTQPPRLD